MNLPNDLLPTGAEWAGHALALGLAALAVWKAPWQRLKDASHLNVWLGATVAVMALWSVKAGIRPGLNFHLLGVTVLTLMFGPWLAYLAVAAVLVMVTAFGAAGWDSLSLNLLCMGAVPIGVSYLILSLVERKLPHHFFIYIFLCAFFAAGLSIVSSGAAEALLFLAAGTYNLDYLTQNYLPYYILLAWSEGLLSGMAMTLMVVYTPHWVATFDDVRYLQNK